MEKNFLFNFEERPHCIIANSNKKFPLRRIFCVCANYVAHAVEMGRNPDRDPPFFFSKPSDAIVNADSSISASIPYPAQTNNLHYEVELVVAIGKKGKDLDIENSLVSSILINVSFAFPVLPLNAGEIPMIGGLELNAL